MDSRARIARQLSAVARNNVVSNEGIKVDRMVVSGLNMIAARLRPGGTTPEVYHVDSVGEQAALSGKE